jgi:type II secretory pathway pseudopilin PulG
MSTFKNKKGFLLVESLVAISIVLLVVTVSMTILSTYTVSNRVNTDRSIANYLAVDAIEYIRQLKDSNVIRASRGEGVQFTNGIQSECLLGEECRVNTIVPMNSGVPKVTLCESSGGNPTEFGVSATEPTSNCPKLLYHEDRGYQYTQGGSSKFTRIVTIEKSTSGSNYDYIKVDVEVRWVDKGVTNRVFSNVDLYRW